MLWTKQTLRAAHDGNVVDLDQVRRARDERRSTTELYPTRRRVVRAEPRSVIHSFRRDPQDAA